MKNMQPFASFPGIVERQANLIDLMVRDRPGVTGYRLWGTDNITDAYGTLAVSGLAGDGGTNFATMTKGGTFMSATLQRDGRGSIDESTRGMTRFKFDLGDFVVPGNDMPPDDQMFFVRLQESHTGFVHATQGAFLTVPAAAVANANYPIRGPILVIPPPIWWGQGQPGLALSGVAPSGTTSAAGAPPVYDETVQVPLPLHLVLPRPATKLTIRNEDGGGGVLLVSLGLGHPMVAVADGETIDFFSGGPRELVLARLIGAGGCAFSLHAGIELGEGG